MFESKSKELKSIIIKQNPTQVLFHSRYKDQLFPYKKHIKGTCGLCGLWFKFLLLNHINETEQGYPTCSPSFRDIRSVPRLYWPFWWLESSCCSQLFSTRQEKLLSVPEASFRTAAQPSLGWTNARQAVHGRHFAQCKSMMKLIELMPSLWCWASPG